MEFRVKSWKAVTPDLEECPRFPELCGLTDLNHSSTAIKQVPPLLRRRFNLTGRCVVGAAMPLLSPDTKIPSVFVSRHGDAELSLSLQQDLGRGSVLSPTHFSLAVHNAISGLFSIARKDTSAINSIAPAEGLVVQGLFEVLGLLQEHDEILCVWFDAPLPELLKPYCPEEPFPYAVAAVISKTSGESFSLRQEVGELQSLSVDNVSEMVSLLCLLDGSVDEIATMINGCRWVLERTEK